MTVRPPRDIKERIDALGPWFHDLELGGVQTAPEHPLGNVQERTWPLVQGLLPADVRGATVLDIGCNGGFYSLALHERGARVTAIDHDARFLAQARLAAEMRQADIEFHEMDVYDVTRLGRTFDIVLFMGVLYHLRHPLRALEQVAQVVGDRMIYQTLVRGSDRVLEPASDYPFAEEAVFEEEGYPVLHFVEHRYAGDPTNWWIPNESAARAMVRTCGLGIERRAAAGVYLCRKGSS